MAITRAQAEQELVSRAGNKMQMVGMAITVDGNNASLDSPFSTALRKMGFSVSAVDDAALAGLSDAEIDEFYDRAELRLLENIQGNFNLADLHTGSRWEQFGGLVSQIEKRIAALRELVANDYGDGGSALVGGYIALDFAEKGDDEIDP